jgi:hypothetical protein
MGTHGTHGGPQELANPSGHVGFLAVSTSSLPYSCVLAGFPFPQFSNAANAPSASPTASSNPALGLVQGLQPIL